MRALTLIQPWAWAVAYAGKDYENRRWRPPPDMIGKRMAIHAGKRWDEIAAERIRESFGFKVPGRDEMTFGAVVATARIAGVRRGCDAVTSPWFSGPVGWRLTRVVALPEPVHCRGMQGLWTLPDDVAHAVSEQVAAAAQVRL